MAFIPAALQVATVALGAYGISESAKAGRKAASAADEAAQIEAAQLEERAKATLAAGSFNAERIAIKAQRILSSQRAALAAGNNDTTDETSREIMKRTVQESSIDQLLEMIDAESDAKKDRYQAAVTRKTGKTQANIIRNQTRARSISDTASLLNSANQVDWSKLFS